MAYPVDVTIQGLGLETDGFTANGTIAGLGLITLGFLWPCDGIWSSSEDNIVTTWVSSQAAATVEQCAD